MTVPVRLPAELIDVRYDGRCIPDGSHDLSRGSNCQTYAYAVLANFGFAIEPLRSSELWADRTSTRHVDGPFEILDLLLFSPEGNAHGAHVGLWAGAGQVLHLCRSAGRPAIWRLDEFALRPQYCTLIGAKRCIGGKGERPRGPLTL